MNRLALTLAFAALPVLAGCSGGADDQVEAVSATEAKALDDAAEMLEQRRLPPDTLTEESGAQDTPAEGEADQ
jgi:hypothetical protein